jgi:hypothetical protein
MPLTGKPQPPDYGMMADMTLLDCNITSADPSRGAADDLQWLHRQ